METLRTPKTGRSRFSKALPAPPSFLESKNKTSLLPSLPPTLPSAPPQLPPLSLGLSNAPPESPTPSSKPVEKDWSLLPRIQTGPPLPPPKQLIKETPTMAAVSRPLNSPLPPLPKKLGAPPPMSIPRRPVPAPRPAVMPTPAPAPASPALSLSPVESYSSLLSAYSNRSSESTPRSSTNSANDLSSAKESYSAVSPREQPKDARKPEAIAPPTLPRDELELPPPPPLKDAQRSNTPPVDQQQAGQSLAATQPVPTLANSSPQQEQLWRRRSLRSEKSLAVPELKLVTSHGSTAASGQNPSQVAQGDSSPRSLPAAPQNPVEPSTLAAGSRIPLPRSSNAAFPGRNIRPAASRQQINSPQETMGQKMSRPAKDMTSGVREEGNAVKADQSVVPQAPRPVHPSVSPMKSMPNVASPVVRLPTPEYESSDVKNPIVETVVSPVSPASSPDLPTDAKSPVTRKAVGDAENQVRHTKSNPALVPKAVFAGRPSMDLPASPASNRERTPNLSQFPARTTSRLGDQYRPPATTARRDLAGPVGSLVAKTREQQPRRAPDELRTVSENGSTASDETVKPKVPATDTANPTGGNASLVPQIEGAEAEESDLTDHPGAALFPRNWYSPLSENGVMDARPLENKHFRCHTRHRYMTAARQRFNPIACRTCGHKDRVAECYICSACHLNICVSCCGSLRKLKGDLDQLLVQLKEKNAETQETLEHAQDKARPDSGTFTIPATNPPPPTFVIEAQ